MNETFVILYETDKPNINGHVYPKEVVRKALEKYSEKIKEGRSICELHAESYEVNTCGMSIGQASHIILGYEEVANGFKITAKTLKTLMGDVLKGLPEEDVRFGIAGIGKIDENVITELEIISIDILPVNPK